MSGTDLTSTDASGTTALSPSRNSNSLSRSMHTPNSSNKQSNTSSSVAKRVLNRILVPKKNNNNNNNKKSFTTHSSSLSLHSTPAFSSTTGLPLHERNSQLMRRQSSSNIGVGPSDVSVGSDNIDSSYSVSCNSIDTVKASNIHNCHQHQLQSNIVREYDSSASATAEPGPDNDDNEGVGVVPVDGMNLKSKWMKLKRFVGGNKGAGTGASNNIDGSHHSPEIQRRHTGSVDFTQKSEKDLSSSCDIPANNRRRIHSLDVVTSDDVHYSNSHNKRSRNSTKKLIRSPSLSASPEQQGKEQQEHHHNHNQQADSARNTPNRGNKNSKSRLNHVIKKCMLDDALRGRLDGMDVLSLCPPTGSSICQHYQQQSSSSSSSPTNSAGATTATTAVNDITSASSKDTNTNTNNLNSSNHMEKFSCPTYSFTGRSTKYTASDMVSDMLWTSAGRDPPEMILEGYFRSDRWFVKIDVPKKAIINNNINIGVDSKNTTTSTVSEPTVVAESSTFSTATSTWSSSSPPPTPTTKTLQIEDTEKDDDGEDNNTTTTCSTVILVNDNDNDNSMDQNENIPGHKLWGSMWGENNKPPPIPSHMTSVDDVCDEDDVLELASSHSVPIDVDEDLFIVSSPDHLKAVHDIAAVPIKHGKFDDALKIFDKMLKGLEARDTDECNHLFSLALHNMAIILMWQAKYEEALGKLQEAVQIRKSLRQKNNAGIAVTLVRIGFVHFALEQFKDAINAFQEALQYLSEKDKLVIAQILNNIAVVRYQFRDFTVALKDFSCALEIQRSWLEGPLRRESNVYTTSVIIGNMGKVYLERGDYDLALNVYEEALLLQTSIFAKDHDLILASLIHLATAKAKNDKMKHALKIMKGVLRSQVAQYGRNSCEAIETSGVIGYMQFDLEIYHESLTTLSTVRRWQKENLNNYDDSSSNPCVYELNEFIKQVETSIEKSIQSIWI